MFNSTRISKLEEQAQNLTAELEAVNSAKAEIEAKLAEATTAHAAALADLQAKLDQANADHEAALAKINAEHTEKFEAAVSEEVVKRCASAGVEPIKTASSKPAEENKMTRAEFDQLSASAKSAFCRGGGKLTN